MRPLQSIAMGLLVIVLVAPVHGYDILPDPIGWVLVLLGLRDLPLDLSYRSPLTGLASVAGVTSAALWVPGLRDPFERLDDSLAWAASLPQAAFFTVLTAALSVAAARAEDTRAARWLLVLRTLVVVVAVLPALVFGAGVEALRAPTNLLAAVVAPILLLWALFSYAARPWASAIRPGAARDPGLSS